MMSFATLESVLNLRPRVVMTDEKMNVRLIIKWSVIFVILQSCRHLIYMFAQVVFGIRGGEEI
jgi:hypothetical protein